MMALSTAELGVLDWIAQHLHTVALDYIMPWLSRLTDRGEVWILLGILLLAFYRKDRGVGVQVLLALLLSLLLCNLVLKNAVGRIRPFELKETAALLIPAPLDPSFPSGHSSASFAAATVLLLNRWEGRWAALVLAALIAFSRLYLYVHYPTDVVGGILVGVLCGVLAKRLWWKLENSRRPKGGLPEGI